MSISRATLITLLFLWSLLFCPIIHRAVRLVIAEGEPPPPAPLQAPAADIIPADDNAAIPIARAWIELCRTQGVPAVPAEDPYPISTWTPAELDWARNNIAQLQIVFDLTDQATQRPGTAFHFNPRDPLFADVDPDIIKINWYGVLATLIAHRVAAMRVAAADADWNAYIHHARGAINLARTARDAEDDAVSAYSVWLLRDISWEIGARIAQHDYSPDICAQLIDILRDVPQTKGPSPTALFMHAQYMRSLLRMGYSSDGLPVLSRFTSRRAPDAIRERMFNLFALDLASYDRAIRQLEDYTDRSMQWYNQNTAQYDTTRHMFRSAIANHDYLSPVYGRARSIRGGPFRRLARMTGYPWSVDPLRTGFGDHPQYGAFFKPLYDFDTLIAAMTVALRVEIYAIEHGNLPPCLELAIEDPEDRLDPTSGMQFNYIRKLATYSRGIFGLRVPNRHNAYSGNDFEPTPRRPPFNANPTTN